MADAAGSAPQAKLLAPYARRRTQLKEKGKTRPHTAIVKRLPAGSGDIDTIPKGKAIMAASVSHERGVDEYCKQVKQTVSTFKDGHRTTQTSTAEHDMNMRIHNS